jgi:iron complex transport system substrate-binding protein
MKSVFLFAVSWFVAVHASAAISVRDDNGAMVVLQQPAQRVVTLAPHATELVFAAGGGDKIVGTVTYSDYPPEARIIARVGDHRQIDLERIIALKPDLLVVWLHGNAERQLEPLRRLGIPLYYSEPHNLQGIPDSVIRLGKLLGREPQAQKSADELRARLNRLGQQYRRRPSVRVFYQVWDRPLYTLNGSHIVSDAIRLCGGENVFARLSVKAPTVTVEAVLKENPEVVITGNRRNQDANGLEMWKQYPALLASRRGNLHAIETDLLVRPGPRMIDGAAAVCQTLEKARSRRTERP